MKHLIDSLLDKTTMYRLTLIYLAALVVAALGLSALGLLGTSPLDIAGTTALFLAVCWLSNRLFARLFRVTANRESALITALILALIAGPVSLVAEPKHAAFLAAAALVAMASKYVLAPRRQHVFNPAALGIFVTGLALGEYSTWWVGNVALLPLVALGGILILRKIERFRIVGLFLASAGLFIFGYSLLQGLDPAGALQNIAYVFLHTEIGFFAVVMLTEPLTSPKPWRWQALYAILVAFFFLPQLTLFGVSFSPEAALLIGNLFSYAVNPRRKLALRLKEKREIGTGILSFSFDYPKGFRHEVGQYMEWTLPLAQSDARGNRRYFTIASSPTEEELLIAARFYEPRSAYKRSLAGMRGGEPIVAADLAGSFVLPRDSRVPLAFIAGGIGITPFRSMVKYLLDKGERRSAVLLYSNYGPDEIVFAEVFERARAELGLKTVYALTDPARVPSDWPGRTGLVDAAMIAAEVPDYADRLFYISGSLAMVEKIARELRSLGVKRSRIRTDFFPGYPGGYSGPAAAAPVPRAPASAVHHVTDLADEPFRGRRLGKEGEPFLENALTEDGRVDVAGHVEDRGPRAAREKPGRQAHGR